MNTRSGLSKCMSMLVLIAQVFAVTPVWAHPGHDAVIQHGDHDNQVEQHIHSHDHHDMKHQDGSKMKQKPAGDCCDSSQECSHCSIGHCSSGSAMVCSPISFQAPDSVSSENIRYSLSFTIAPVSGLFRLPIQA